MAIVTIRVWTGGEEEMATKAKKKPVKKPKKQMGPVVSGKRKK
jgi:hypothetical protein